MIITAKALLIPVVFGCVFFQNFFVRVDGFEFEWEAGSPGSLTFFREFFCFRAL